MSLFKNFQFVNYLFGDEISPAVFQNMTTYVDLVDQLSDEASFYEFYNIPDGYRPDNLSQLLYGTPDYYWMFYLLNDKLRTQGWPLNEVDVYAKAKIYYPNDVLFTDQSFYKEFYLGDIVCSPDTNSSPLTFSNPAYKARILEKNYDLGQIIVKPIKEVRSITIVSGGSGYTAAPAVTISGGGGLGATAEAVLELDEDGAITGRIASVSVLEGGEDFITHPTVTIADPQTASGDKATATALANLTLPGLFTSTDLYSQKDEPDNRLWDADTIERVSGIRSLRQWVAPRHWVNSDGEREDLPISVAGGVDNLNPVGDNNANLTAVTYQDHLINENNKLRKIKIFKPEVANQINSEFHKLVRQ